MGVDMSNNPPPTSHTKDFFASPALSLSLAGIFRHAGEEAAASSKEAVEEGEEGSGGGRREETVEISSGENSGHTRSRSEEMEFEGEGGEDEDGGGDDKSKKKKRKKYHRHTAEQIREMEALFKESPHPDEKQRQQLSKQLGLAPRQVKFWFQNRRTQIKAIQERHENSLLKSEIEKLREENKGMRETVHKACCPNCGMATTSRDATMSTEEQQLRIENAKLKSEVEKLRVAIGRYNSSTGGGGSTSSPSCSGGNNNNNNEQLSLENRSSLDLYSGIFGVDKTRMMQMVNQALDELVKMATVGEPLWVRSVETGREILNYDEYLKEFSRNKNNNNVPKRSIEASRDTGVVFVDLPRLVQRFLDVNQWKDMFPCLISKAATVDVICTGEGANRDGAVQLMFAELQMLTPLVGTREVYFVRYCKQLNAEQWAIVDVSVDKVEDNIDASLLKCRKRPSGCIIEDKSNGHCKVIWVEHVECQKSTVHATYRSIVNSGVAFGAKHWIATLQLQCERLVFSMATNVPMKDSSGVATLAGRKSILKLAERMTWNLCQAIGGSSMHTWTKVTSKTGEDIRISSRKNVNDPGEPIGVIICAVSSLWLPVSPNLLFHFLRDESRRTQWDIMSSAGTVQCVANLAKGQDRGNSVAVQTINSKEKSMWVVQDSSTNAFESMVVYAAVDMESIQSVMTGCDSSNVAILPSGFSILPDGSETRPLVISSKKQHHQQQQRNYNTSSNSASQHQENNDNDDDDEEEGGSLFTMAFQVLTNSSPSAKLTMESVESVTTLISCTLRNIRTSLHCEDG